MVPSSPMYRIALLLAFSAGTAHAQSEGTRNELIRSGGVTLSEQAPADHASSLAVPIHNEPIEPNSPAKKLIPLARKQHHASTDAAERPKAVSPTQSLATVGGSLAIVLGLFFALAWVTRRGMPARIGKLPGEVIEVLGKAPLSKGQELQMVRVGSKLLLLCVTQHGSETLTEISDPQEVDRLSAVCRRNSPQGVSATFDQMLTSMGREPARGFAEDPRVAEARVANERVAGTRASQGARRHA